MPVMDGLEATPQDPRAGAEFGAHGTCRFSRSRHTSRRATKSGVWQPAWTAICRNPFARNNFTRQSRRWPHAERPADRASAPAGFDLAVALDSVDGDQELLRDVIEVFLGECPQLLQELKQSIAAEDFADDAAQCPHDQRLQPHLRQRPRDESGSRVGGERASSRTRPTPGPAIEQLQRGGRASDEAVAGLLGEVGLNVRATEALAVRRGRPAA